MNTRLFRQMSAFSLLFAATAVGQQGPAAPPATAPASTRPAAKADPMIADIVKDVSQDRVTAILKKLEGFATRNTMSNPAKPDADIGAARQWIFDEFKSYSPRLQVSFDTHDIPRGGRITQPTELRNVVAILPGKTPDAKNRWIIISGHYDTVNLHVAPGAPTQQAEAPAPGVCDDGSGTSCVMECARVLSKHEFNATLVFVAFAGEEQGLVGAKAMAKELKTNKQEIEAVLNNDIIGTDTSGNGVKDDKRVMVYSEDPDDSPSRQIARFINATTKMYFPEFSAEMVFRYDRFARGGDHTAFNQEGYTAVRMTTPAENFANQHSATDTLANMSPAYTTKVIRVNAAAAASLALAPKPPVTVAPAGAAATGGVNRIGLSRGTGYDAVMRWEYPNPPADLAGFVIVMRSTTAPDWEKEFWAGDVRIFTLKNTQIDHCVLGVKAVDKQGHEGPVSAYINAQRSDAAATAGTDAGTGN